jgi:hypothetical protein
MNLLDIYNLNLGCSEMHTNECVMQDLLLWVHLVQLQKRQEKKDLDNGVWNTNMH